MSKFCGNCGTVMDDAAAVCGNCGAPLAAAPAQEGKKAKFDASVITGVIDGVKKGDKGALMKGGIAIAVVAVVLILIISLFSGSGDEKVAEKLMKNFAKDKPEAIVKLLPAFAFEDIEYSEGISDNAEEGDWEDCFKDDIDGFSKALDAGYGFDEYSIKYELINKSEYGKEYLKDIEDNLDKFEEFEDKKLKKAVDLTYKVVYKGNGEKVIGIVSVTVIKYGSKWCLYSYEFTNYSVENDEEPKGNNYADSSFKYSEIVSYAFKNNVEEYYGY